ncbi:MAG: glycosyltransferase family 4 protein [Prevotellaceae bacterium]|jgi:glycosyltransferase involved in cell wall biosynthesis|nr:glycosyltransferase family 4 protein [Prevotellaceae bacterium]
MKILFITSELPYPVHKNGFSLVNYRLLTKAINGVEIDLISIDKENKESEQMLKKESSSLKNIFVVKKSETKFGKLVNLISVYFWGRPLIKNQYLHRIFMQLLKKNNYDLIYACPLTMISELAYIKNLPPIFLNAIDSYSMLCESFYEKEKNIKNKLKIHLYKAYEKKLLEQASCVNFVSSVDAKHIGKFSNHQNIQNITLGIDTSMFFQNPTVEKESGSLLFSGNFEYKPNADTAKYIAEKLFPVINTNGLNTKLYIVGRNPPQFKTNSNIFITGFVENIAEWYNRCEVFICPLLYGAGIKNKVLEAMACGIPVISSSVGISGIKGLIHGVHFLLADSKEEQISAIDKLLNNIELRNKISDNALRLIKENYNWDKNISLYYKILTELIQK